MYELSLHANQLSGSIPPELGNLSGLWLLGLKHNQLTGDIPTSFINLVNLIEPGTWNGGDGLDLDFNGLNIPYDYPNLSDPLPVFLSQKDPDWHILQSFKQVIGKPGGTLTSLDNSVEFVVPAGGEAVPGVGDLSANLR